MSGQLLPNISISFEDNNYTVAYFYYGCLTAISHRTFDSGITSEKTSYRIAILDQNLTKLPTGEYTLWIYGRTWQQTVVFNETVMTVSDEGTFIQYGTLPPLDIIKQKRSLVFIYTGFVLAFVIVLIPKRKRKS
jgi:ABC-type tungstate transport system permease subunit